MSNLIFKGSSLKGIVKKAKEILFDNSNTSLSATNVQGAIEEIDADLSELNGQIAFHSFKLPSDMSGKAVGSDIPIATNCPHVNGYYLLGVRVNAYNQWRDIDNYFAQYAYVSGSIIGVSSRYTFASNYNGANATAIFVKAI